MQCKDKQPGSRESGRPHVGIHQTEMHRNVDFTNACTRSRSRKHGVHRSWLAARLTYLENRFNMRPLGVVSKKVIGDRKMANAILSCNLREAYSPRISHDRSVSPARQPANHCHPALRYASRRAHPPVTGGPLTSIEQKIHKIKVCITTKPAEPMPKAK